VHPQSRNQPTLPPSDLAAAVDVAHVAEKVAAGANMVVLQVAIDPTAVLRFARALAAAGVDLDAVPLVPSLLPLSSYDSFQRCFGTGPGAPVRVPQPVREEVERLSEDDAALRRLGAELGAAATAVWREAGLGGRRPCHVHLVTMNLAGPAVALLEAAGAFAGTTLTAEAAMRTITSVPWSADADDDSPGRGGGGGGGGRAIFWANRAASLHKRSSSSSAAWTEFPNGRWVLSANPAFGSLQHYLCLREASDRRAMWGTPASVEDVGAVFDAFLDSEGAVTSLPWCNDKPGPETDALLSELRHINRNGVLSINSQPAVNGAPSSHPRFGWGGDGGIVFQKSYLEAFMPVPVFRRMEAALSASPHTSITYHAIDCHGAEHSNVPLSSHGGANAVTWGVFPGREIMQATVVDPLAFRHWAREAFDLWLQWRDEYDGGDDAGSGRASAAGGAAATDEDEPAAERRRERVRDRACPAQRSSAHSDDDSHARRSAKRRRARCCSASTRLTCWSPSWITTTWGTRRPTASSACYAAASWKA